MWNSKVIGLGLVVVSLWMGSAALAANQGVIERQVGGNIVDMISSDTHSYVAQGRTIVTIGWDDNGKPSVSHVSSPLPGLPRNLLIDGDTLLVAVQTDVDQGSIERLSIADPNRPRHLGSLALPHGLPTEWGYLKRVGDLLYLGGGGRHLLVLDTSAPGAAELVFEKELLPSDARLETFQFVDMRYWGDHHLLLSAQTKRLQQLETQMYLLDVTQPHAPREVSRFASSNGDGSIASFPLVFLFDHHSYEVVDWSDFLAPAQAARVSPISSTHNFGGERRGDYLITRMWGGINIIDARDLNNLQRASTKILSWAGIGELTGHTPAPDPHRWLVSLASGQLAVIDLTDLSDPTIDHILELGPGRFVNRIRETDEGLLVSSRFALHSLTPDLEPIARFGMPTDLSPYISDFVVKDDWLVLGSFSFPSMTMRIHGLDDIEPVAELGMGSDDSLWLDGDRLWTVTSALQFDFRQYSLADPATPEELNRYRLSGSTVRAVRRKGSVVYMGGSSGLRIAYLHPDHSLSQFEEIASCSQIVGMDMDDDRLAVACHDQGLLLYDIKQPDHPSLIGHFDSSNPDARGRSALLDGDLLWYGHHTGVELLDISEPQQPLYLASFPTMSLQTRPVLSPIHSFASWLRRSSFSHGRAGNVWVGASDEGLAELRGASPVGSVHTSAWHDPDHPGQGLVLEVLTDQRALVTWFGYDATGQQSWFQGIGTIVDNRVEVAEVYLPQGARFGQQSDADNVTYEKIGSARLAFYDCNGGTAQLDAFGERRITRLQPLARTMRIGCSLEPDAVDLEQSTQTGTWFDPDYPAQGFKLAWLATGEALINWFTNDTNGNQYWIQGVGQPVDDTLVFSDLYSTTATRPPGIYDPAGLRSHPWGEMVLELGCLTGTATYQSVHSRFGSGSQTLRRLTIPEGLSCSD